MWVRTLLVCSLVIAATSCSETPTDTLVPDGSSRTVTDGFEYRAQASLVGNSPQRLVVQASAINRTLHHAGVDYGACSLELRLTPVPATGKVWQSWSRGYACPEYGVHADLDYGDRIAGRELANSEAVAAILGDSLPPGAYRITAFVSLDNAHRAEFDAGTVTLAPVHTPPPAVRVINGIAYRATTSRVNASESRVTLRATNVTTVVKRLRAQQRVDCAVSFVGFITPEDRDAWYTFPLANVWTPSHCVVNIPDVLLDPGESVAVSGTIQVPSHRQYYVALLWVDALDFVDSPVALDGGYSN